MGWEMPWYTITDSFDVDFGVDEWHGHNVFLRDGERVFRTYFINNRGDEAMGTVWSYLDATPLGRQETWEDSPEGYPQSPPYKWWNWHDNYAAEASIGPGETCSAPAGTVGRGRGRLPERRRWQDDMTAPAGLAGGAGCHGGGPAAALSWPGRGAAGWLGLAASPTFAFMAWIAANDAPRVALCSSGSSLLPIDGMTAMYLLMGPFPPIALAEARFRPPGGAHLTDDQRRLTMKAIVSREEW